MLKQFEEFAQFTSEEREEQLASLKRFTSMIHGRQATALGDQGSRQEVGVAASDAHIQQMANRLYSCSKISQHDLAIKP